MVEDRKTTKMREYEAEHKVELEVVIPAYYKECQSVKAVAEKMEISPNTLYDWMLRLGITIRKSVSV